MRREVKLSTQDAFAASEVQSMVTRMGIDASRAEETLSPEILEELEGITAHDPVNIGMGVLFAGPSGTGKTLAARVLASMLEMDLYRVDLAAVTSKYIGETEKHLHQVLARAEELDVVLLFDEADSLFGKRTDVRDSHDRYANIEVNFLLQRMEAYTGLAILATNRRANIDDAFLRWLKIIIEFPMPSKVAKEQSFPKPVTTSTIAYKPRSAFQVRKDDESNDQD